MVAAFALLVGIGAYVFASQDSAPEGPDERVDASTTLVTQKPTDAGNVNQEVKVRELVKVELSAGLPKEITLILEDGTQQTTPLVLEREKGTSPIKVKAVAKGYKTKEIEASFERNEYRAIVLERKVRIAPPPKNPGFKPMEYDD